MNLTSFSRASAFEGQVTRQVWSSHIRSSN
uniref:Uncharacterized protein n=1 Tax=Anguilla anguilla TaxID=7936 RepID=A0A0E9VFR4_ANGAN